MTDPVEMLIARLEDGQPARHAAVKMLHELQARAEAAEETLWRIKQWCEAYPLDVFPEPDFKKARELLEAGGMTLDAISASNMRHVVTGIKKLIEDKNEQ